MPIETGAAFAGVRQPHFDEANTPVKRRIITKSEGKPIAVIRGVTLGSDPLPGYDQYMCWPPLMEILAPVTKAASSEDR